MKSKSMDPSQLWIVRFLCLGGTPANINKEPPGLFPQVDGGGRTEADGNGEIAQGLEARRHKQTPVRVSNLHWGQTPCSHK